jgi:hypothetical protein
MRLALAVAVLALGCDARLGPTVGETADASPNGVDPDAAMTDNNGSADAAPLQACANGRVVYLEFEGATLTQASSASDATQNQAVWMGVGQATLPGFRPNAADRAAQIAEVTDLVKQKLAGIPEITIVTTRPATGPYVMIGFGGVHQTVNVPYLYAVNRLDCGDAAKSDLAWVFEDTPTTQKAADFAVGSILFGLGATGTTSSNDCMCGWLTQCQPSNGACTLSSSIDAALSCPNQTNPQDEVALLHTFCQ